jgi:hypothetical protein
MSGRSSENEGLSQVVISASATASFFLKAGVSVRALSLCQLHKPDNRLLTGRGKERVKQVSPGANNEVRTRHAAV